MMHEVIPTHDPIPSTNNMMKNKTEKNCGMKSIFEIVSGYARNARARLLFVTSEISQPIECAKCPKMPKMIKPKENKKFKSVSNIKI